jgi:hypothetical protein
MLFDKKENSKEHNDLEQPSILPLDTRTIKEIFSYESFLKS